MHYNSTQKKQELLGYVAATGRFKRLSGEGAAEFRDTG